jgi:hypothetical protein
MGMLFTQVTTTGGGSGRCASSLQIEAGTGNIRIAQAPPALFPGEFAPPAKMPAGGYLWRERWSGLGNLYVSRSLENHKILGPPE